MKNKLAKKSTRGRKPKQAVLSGIKPDQETWDEIRCRFICGSNEWAIVALRQSIKSGSQLKDNPFWNRLCAEFERAVLNGDDAAAADWFRRQAKAIEKAGRPSKRAQFEAKVVSLLEITWWTPLGQPENWPLLTDAEWEEQGRPENLWRAPRLVTLPQTPAGGITDKTARDIYNTLDKRFLCKKGKEDDENGPQIVEGCQFETKGRVMDAIGDLATRLQFALKKQARIHDRP